MNQKILLVDRDPAALSCHKRMLESHFEIVCAGSGEEGLVSLRNHGPRLLDVSSLRWTHASHRTAHRGPDATPFSTPPLPMCRMKPQRPARPHPRVSTRASFVRLLGPFPSYLPSRHEPSHARSTYKIRSHLQPMPSFTLRHILALPRVSPLQHSSPIASVAPAASFKSLY